MTLEQLRILHLEDDAADAHLVRRAIQTSGLPATITHVTSRADFVAALSNGPWAIVLTDNSVPMFSGAEALALVRAQHPQTPVIVLSGAGQEEQVISAFRAGAADYILKDHLEQLVIAIHRVLMTSSRP